MTAHGTPQNAVPAAAPVRGADRVRTLLWCGVAALGVTAIGDALRTWEARADVVATGGEFAALTTDTGSEDILVILDQRAEQLLIYGVRNQNAIEFRGRQSLSELFLEARRAAGK
ncbi:MAG: hypothetical protein ACKVS8_02155 [Phycisphaerales bacterium]